VSIEDLIRFTLTETWWRWNRPASEPLMVNDYACHYFNFVEGTAWFVFAGLVLRRWWRFRRSPLEIAYAVAFLLFGISDFVEAWALTSWLLWWKLVNLVALFQLRVIVLRRFYPDRRLF
jgi:hypothetical protein